MNDSNDSDESIMDETEVRSNGGATASPSVPVVGIGASTGGLGAFSRLLGKIPPTTGMAFVVIQHDDSDHPELTQLLASASPIPVVEAVEGMVLEPNRVHVIRSNVAMGIESGRLQVTPRDGLRVPHLTIDHFFRSLAQASGSRAVGIVLTGKGCDGTLGLAEIKAAGGITYAQDPNRAELSEMPRSAIAFGCVDAVLSEEEIAHEIGVLSHHSYLITSNAAKLDHLFQDDPDGYEKILALLLTSGRVDFRHYRPSTIKRRILRRMALRSCASVSDYVSLLSRDVVEISALLKDALIHVTSFFRDAAVYTAIHAQIFPELLHQRNPDLAIRVWVVGCSSGQEAYSLAIELLEFLERSPLRPQIQIFATDISESALVQARAGIYPDSIVSEISPERLTRHFSKVAAGYRINKSIRDLCVFAKHDATADTPFSKIDLVTCRNMLIYLSPAMQARMISTFNYALNNPGYLVLGNSETIGRASDLFSVVNQRHRIYMRNRDSRRLHGTMFSPLPRPLAIPSDSPVPVTASSLADYQRTADRMVLAEFVPPAVLIDAESMIIQFRGDTNGFLDHSRGEATLNLLKMVPYPVAQVLKGAIEEARQTNANVDRPGVCFRKGEVLEEIGIRIWPVRPRGIQESCLLVMFQRKRTEITAVESRPLPPPAVPEQVDSLERDDEMARLKRELLDVKRELASANDHLKALAEETDNVTDELKTANNDAHSNNEELRCTNEELQTAKEEVISANEELATLNEELRNRNHDLTSSSNDLTNLLDSIDIPVLMLSEDLHIRRMTRAAQRSLHLSDTDVGRPLAGLDRLFVGPDFQQLATGVIHSQRIQEVEITDHKGHWFTLRIYPYLAEGNRISGVVVILIDIDAIKVNQELLRKDPSARGSRTPRKP